ncbi:putative major facilitator superfamily protein [Lyophyllum shimeji]|uniref:ATP-dependent RNA helicase n=1 Tax=Lyophyllum shimeji TaxID=47721 RepID=A0A9P3PV42_LYOSH|nr:putative major facilitator superfamily protein [Lyophyllum shimeji]
MMQPSGEVYTTPLPTLSMVVLSITMLGEFLSANVSTPFLLFMVKGFNARWDEAEVAFWTGILVSTFFLTQFVTSLLWATVAEKHGRRSVLMISLLGSAITCLAFGTATTLQQAICIRLMQGIFAGAVGVARGSVAFITDPSNEGRAYAILGFCWGLGGVAGAIIGGSFERPAVKWPEVFGSIPLFTTYPYLLPCALAALIMLFGSILSCFLGPDGGPREGAIRLGPEKIDLHPPIPEEESTPPSPALEAQERRSFIGKIGRKVSQKLSGYFAQRVHDAHRSSETTPTLTSAVPLSSPGTRLERTRTFSRTSRANGSAYGYAGSYRNRLASNATINAHRGSMASSLRRRRGSNMDSVREAAGETPDLNFAQRLLMANENAVTNIADLWVAAAMNVDNEDPFESDSEGVSDDDVETMDLEQAVGEDVEVHDALDDESGEGRGRLPSFKRGPIPIPRLGAPHRQSNTAASSRRPTSFSSPSRPSHSHQSPLRHPSVSFSQQPYGTPTSRRFSTTVPSIFSHPGVKTPSAVLDAQRLLASSDVDHPSGNLLDPVSESRTQPAGAQPDVESLVEKTPSLTSQLPILVIIQYGMLALHTTTHDQVFMSYLVTDYDAGGLNLNAGHFAQLIALMCLAQIAYQFYLYPNIGPPRGRFSHLAMFRVGSTLFIPAYLSVILYRPFASASDDGNFLVMTALALSTALRYCGITFGYTAISILLNYMTPPSAVGYANGIAQSIVSLARCAGPVIGGYLWSTSIQDDPSVAAKFCKSLNFLHDLHDSLMSLTDIPLKRAAKRKVRDKSSATRKKVKTRHATLDELPWKSVTRPQIAGLDGDDGILDLEEVEGVEVVYEETEGGKLLKFKVIEADDTPESKETLSEGSQNGHPEAEAEEVASVEDVEDTFDSAELLPEWHQFSLHPLLLKVLYSKGFKSPTPIQAASLPFALADRDVVGVAQTGSGKTLAYGLPILHHLLSQPKPKAGTKRQVRALILAPTRELALQVSSHLKACLNPCDVSQPSSEEPQKPVLKEGKLANKGKGKAKAEPEAPISPKSPPHVSVAAIVGGMSAQKQRRILDRGVDVLVATPGRLWDIMQEDDALSREIKGLRFLVLDEADRMIEAGHFAELENILRLTFCENKEDQIQPEFDASSGDDGQEALKEEYKDGLQTFVFSATLSKDLQRNVKRKHRPKKKRNEKPASTLDDLLLRLDFRDPDPEVIDLSPAGGVVSTLQESKIECLSADKDVYLYYFLLRHPGKSLVFLSSIDGIRRLMPLTELLNIKAFPLHSQLEQRQRLKNLDRFSNTPNSVLLATDIAARGLDIPAVDHVIHFQIPRSADAYVHRNGRTARAMRKGFSLFMCAPDEKRAVRALLANLGRQEDEIPEISIELNILDKLKYRVQLARKIETAHHKVKKANHDRNWMKETAAAMEIELDSDYVSDREETPANKKRKARDAKNAALKAELNHLLSQPLFAKGVSAKYITSGSRPIADDLIAGANHEVMMGLKKEEAGSNLVSRKKKKKQPVKEEFEEWGGLSTEE